MRSKVAYVTGIVKYIFKRVFRHQNVGGGGGSPPPLAPAPPAPPHTFPADKCGERFHLVVFYIYYYILLETALALLQGCCDVSTFMHDLPIRLV